MLPAPAISGRAAPGPAARGRAAAATIARSERIWVRAASACRVSSGDHGRISGVPSATSRMRSSASRHSRRKYPSQRAWVRAEIIGMIRTHSRICRWMFSSHAAPPCNSLRIHPDLDPRFLQRRADRQGNRQILGGVAEENGAGDGGRSSLPWGAAELSEFPGPSQARGRKNGGCLSAATSQNRPAHARSGKTSLPLQRSQMRARLFATDFTDGHRCRGIFLRVSAPLRELICLEQTNLSRSLRSE